MPSEYRYGASAARYCDAPLTLKPRGRFLYLLCFVSGAVLLALSGISDVARKHATPVPEEEAAAASPGVPDSWSSASGSMDRSGGRRSGGGSAAASAAAVAAYTTQQRLRGLVFNSTTPLLNATGELEHNVTWCVVASFSPAVERHAELMFRERFNECEFHAMGPAMSTWRGRVVANVRLWLSQYLLNVIEERKKSLDSWQENYVYSVEVDSENYRPLSPGRLLAIPTTTNAYSSYRKDGPMDPRSFVLNDRLYLAFYSYALEQSRTEMAARMYLWDYENSVKVRLRLTGMPLQKGSDINWTPLVVGGTDLYFVYSFDPLRVLRCDPLTGACALVYSQVRRGEHAFTKEFDHLRGGTPFVEYRHPYYVSVAHSTTVATTGWTLYHVHLVVVSVDPWRIVYVSEPMKANSAWIAAERVVTSAYIGRPFWYPTALLPRDDWESVDVGCHRNDYSSHVIRLTGLRLLLSDVVRADEAAAAEAAAASTMASTTGEQRSRSTASRPRVVQQYALETIKRHLFEEGTWAWFAGDYRKY